MPRPITITALGNAQVSTAQSKFGGASALFDGTGDYLRLTDNFTQSGDFTIEGWIRANATGGTPSIFTIGDESAERVVVYMNGTTIQYDTYSGAGPDFGTSFTVSTGVWYHLAVVRSGSTITIYRDGTNVGSGTRTGTVGNANEFKIGQGWNGYIDEIRVSNSARYTSNFTAPTAAFTNDANTMLLLHTNGTNGSTVFLDDTGSRSQKGISAIGNAQVDTAQSKFGGASALFDGTDDWLDVIDSSGDWAFGTGSDFTIEGWFRPSITGSGRVMYSLYDGSTFRASFYFDTGAVWFYTPATGGLQTGDFPTANVWSHWAITRSSGTTKFWYNGVETLSTATSWNATFTRWILGGENPSGTTIANDYTGHMDELRISNTARYTAGFTAPTAAFNNDANTLLLIHADGTDASTAFFDDNATPPIEEGAAALTFNSSIYCVPGDTDPYYIDLGYIDTAYYESFGVLQDVESNLYVVANLNASIELIKNVSVALTATTSVSSTISHIEGADLFAFTEAAIAVQVDRIRENNISATAVFNIATSVERIQQGDADADAVFSAIIDGLRSRDVTLDAQAAFSFACDVEKIKFGNGTFTSESSLSCDATEITPFIEFEAYLNCECNFNADCGKIADYLSNIFSTANLTATISHIEGADLTAFSDAALSATVERTRDAVSTQSSEFAVETLVLKITGYSASLDNQFAVSASVDKFVQGSSNQSSSFQIATIAFKTSDIQSSVSGSFSVSAQGLRLKEIVLIAFNFASITAIPFVRISSGGSFQSTFSLTSNVVKTTNTDSTQAVSTEVNTDVQRFRDYDAAILSEFNQTTLNQRLRDDTSSLQSEFSITAVIGKQQGIDLYAFSNNSLIADPVVNRSASATYQVSAETNVTATRIPQIDIAVSSQIALTATNIRVRFASVALSADGGILSVIDIIPGVQSLLTATFTTNRPYVDSGYVDDDYATNFVTVANYIVDNLQQLTSAFTLIADGNYAGNGAALLANSGTLTVAPVVISSALSTQQSAFSTTTNANYNVVVSSTIESQFSVFANIGTQNDIFLTAFSNVALAVNANKIVSAVSNNSIVSTFFADTEDSLTTKGEANLLSTFTSSAAIRKITRFSADLQASGFTITVGTTSKVQDANLSSFFSVNAAVNVIRNGVANVVVVSSTSTQITRVRVVGAVISSALTFVVAIRDLRLDEIVYVIPGENYVYEIISESRLHSIYGETRIRSVTGETRIRTIQGESRIHIID